jgi:Peptidase family C25/FlgD Ig-like domain
MNWRYLRTLSVLIFTATIARATELPTVRFDRSPVRQDSERNLIGFESLETTSTIFSTRLPYTQVFVELVGAESASQVAFVVMTRQAIQPEFLITEESDIATSEEGRYDFANLSSTAQLRMGAVPAVVEGEVQVDGRRFAKLLLFPVSITSVDSIFCNEEIAITVGSRTVAPAELVSSAQIQEMQQALMARESSAMKADSENGSYVVITCDSLVDACLPLVRHKISLGFPTFIRPIEDILASYTGVDDAEKIRNYLKDFYLDGGEYVLLAGDESILPIRHAYHIDVAAPLTIDKQLLCDLYFADLTGTWDFDNDGTYGERNQDRADLTPELRVGRLPVSTSSEIERYTRKLIAYETNPGRGDFSYLTRALFFSSDEMRDYSGGGQHALISKAYPPQITIDTTVAVEAASGADPAPTNIGGAFVNDSLASGYGIVNIIAHGRYDGFAVKSATYNAWPKSLYLSDYLGGSHTDASILSANGKISFYYSLSCDVGGFDEDLGPLNHIGTNFVQRMLTLDSAGAVAFVGYSRWGWVSSSHLLQKVFFDSLFAHPGRPAIQAMYDSKAVYSYLRDLNYGQNFYGDPAMAVYTSRPKRLSLTYDQTIEGLIVSGEIDGSPARGCVVRLVSDTILLGTYTLNDDGMTTIDLPFELGSNYTITARAEGAVTVAKNYRPGLGAGTGDDDVAALPDRFSLSQNYPNPFNPSTSISFDLPRRSPVTVTIVNILGEVVSTVVDGEYPAGTHEVVWDGKTDGGASAASGIYFYRLSAGDFAQTRKMILLK